jgi:Protein of unknown function (DUF3551)
MQHARERELTDGRADCPVRANATLKGRGEGRHETGILGSCGMRRLLDVRHDCAGGRSQPAGPKKALMLAILALATIVATAPARAQTYDPDYPVCMHVFGFANYFDCSFTSLPQCAASASGRSAQCVINPYYASAYEEPIRRPLRRHRRR